MPLKIARMVLPSGFLRALLITCNTAFARQQGYTAEEISSMSIFEMYERSTHQYIKQRIAEADHTGHVQYEANISAQRREHLPGPNGSG